MSPMDNYTLGLETLYLFSESCGKLVHAMGKPVFVDDGKRAYVMLDENKEIVFCLDQEFFGSLTYDEDMAFVLLHEALHVSWNHLREQSSDEYENKKVLTIAHEVVINDSIPKISGLISPDKDSPAGDHMSGPEMFNHDFSGMTTRQAYDYILNNAPEDMDLNDYDTCEIAVLGGDGDGGGDSSTSLDELMAAVKDAIDGEFQDSSDALAEVAAPGTMNDSDTFNDGGQGSSTGGSLTTRPQTGIEDVEFDFVELLAKINPKVMSSAGKNGSDDYRNNWTAPRHSMRAYYPEMIIPRLDYVGPDGDSIENSSPDVLFATDQSGSISSKYVNISYELLKKIPENLFTPHMAVWANNCVEYIPNRSLPYIGGGTDIHSVYKYADNLRKKMNIDPYVVVFTDGQYYWRNDLDIQWIKDRWFFVAYTNHDVRELTSHSRVINVDNIYKLSDLWKK